MTYFFLNKKIIIFMSIISSFIVLLIAIFISLFTLWLNEQYNIVDFEVSDYINVNFDNIKSLFDFGTKTNQEIIDNIDPNMIEAVAKELKEDYISLKNEMINYKDHNNYLVNERKMMSMLKLLKQEIQIFDEENEKIKALEQKDNFTDGEIKEIKRIMNDYIK